jgi:hypothetical protein
MMFTSRDAFNGAQTSRGPFVFMFRQVKILLTGLRQVEMLSLVLRLVEVLLSLFGQVEFLLSGLRQVEVLSMGFTSPDAFNGTQTSRGPFVFV